MWVFLDHLLSKGGVVAVAIAVIVLAFVAAVRALWNTNQALSREYRVSTKEYADAIKKIQEEHAGLIRDIQDAHTAAISELYEKRAAEAHEISDRLLDTLRKVDESTGKIRSSMDTLAIALRDRRP